MIDFSLHIAIDRHGSKNALTDFFDLLPPVKVIESSPGNDLLIWGDPILPPEWANLLKSKLTADKILRNIKGHFYFVFRSIPENSIVVGNSFCSILPVYFAEKNGVVYASNNPVKIKSPAAIADIDKQFILENLLFNFPLSDKSIVRNVGLLPANSYLKLTIGKCRIVKYHSIPESFVENPVRWKKAVNNLADLFIEKVKHYLPDEFYFNSLTGGFDGRTLAAAGLHLNRNFSAYSFGSENTSDIIIAEQLANLAGIPFLKFVLDSKYAHNHSLLDGMEFILGSAGTATFARAHYLYASKELAKQSKYVITGNFGSEVFRTAHNAGALISHNLHTIFAARNYDEAIQGIENAMQWKWINRAVFDSEWESLKEFIRKMPVFDKELDRLTQNQKFYITVFEEIFRKYFGAEMVNQFRYLANRTPFLDYDFFNAILKTELSGVYSDFFTHNPFKRFKGQVTYAHVIKKTYKPFAKAMTGKGYRPVDLLSMHGNLLIAKSYFSKKYLQKKQTYEDAYFVNGAFTANRNYWKSIKPDHNLFNHQMFAETLDRFPEQRDTLFNALSQAWYINHLTENYGLKF